MPLTLSRRAIAQRQAEDAVDAHFADAIRNEIGPLGALHALKRAQALAGSGALLDDDRDAILARAAEQDERLAVIDRDRRDLKRRVREATTADDIRAVLAEAGIHHKR